MAFEKNSTDLTIIGNLPVIPVTTAGCRIRPDIIEGARMRQILPIIALAAGLFVGSQPVARAQQTEPPASAGFEQVAPAAPQIQQSLFPTYTASPPSTPVVPPKSLPHVEQPAIASPPAVPPVDTTAWSAIASPPPGAQPATVSASEATTATPPTTPAPVVQPPVKLASPFAMFEEVTNAGPIASSPQNSQQPPVTPASVTTNATPLAPVPQTIEQQPINQPITQPLTSPTTQPIAPPPCDPPAVEMTPVQKVFCTPAEEEQFPTVAISGFFHLDTGFYDQDDRNERTVGNLENGTDFRRARLLAHGNVTADVSYHIEFDFALSQPLFTDLWMEFANVGEAMNVRIGRFRQPFGMTELNGIRDLWFLERPLLFALSPFRQTGAMAYGHHPDETFTWAGSVYQYASDYFGNVMGDNGGWGTSARLTGLLLDDPTTGQLIHVGADYSHNNPARDGVRYLNFPEFFMGQTASLFVPGIVASGPIISNPPFVDTGLVPTESTDLFNLEAAAASGDLYVQSEFRWAVLDQIGGPTDTFPGAYVMARYVLTGEELPYDRKNGIFGRIVPSDPVRFGTGSGIGAWEVAARWSWLDLNGTNLPGPGRELNDLTLGLNWYVNGFTKFQLNYIHAFLNDPRLGDSDANIYALRGQIDF
jgi:phosphate-selective porin OprO/OprP